MPADNASWTTLSGKACIIENPKKKQVIFMGLSCRWSSAEWYPIETRHRVAVARLFWQELQTAFDEGVSLMKTVMYVWVVHNLMQN